MQFTHTAPEYANEPPVAIRIIRSAQELGWTTVAIYCGQDTSHAAFADETIELDDVSWFMSVERMIEIAKRYVYPRIDRRT